MRIADPNPPFCSSCCNSQPELRHVDFDAAYDGPVVGATAESHGQAIDDLILCERCVRDAGALIGLVPEGEALRAAKAEIARLKLAVDDVLALSKPETVAA